MSKEKKLKTTKTGVVPRQSVRLNWIYTVIPQALVLILAFLVATGRFKFPTSEKKGSAKGLGSVEDIKARVRTLPCEDTEGTERCAPLAAEGHCDTSPGWMSVMCAASCNGCELLDAKVRCDPVRINMTQKMAFQNGEMNEMFESIPGRFPELKISFLSRDPYILQFDEFLSDTEIDALLTNVGMMTLKRSTDQGKVDPKTGVQEQKVSSGRTSENAWCMGKCEKDPIVKNIQKRISDLVNVSEENFESFQMLRYEIGQEYKRHHDMSPSYAKELCGPRILTFFMYLSEVEEGGGTRFTDIDPQITMIPKKGSAILWPSVLNDDVFKQHPKTFHQAMPVIKGTKYGANTWIHLYDYRTPNHFGCTGSFS